jgi:hypothetical protein
MYSIQFKSTAREKKGKKMWMLCSGTFTVHNIVWVHTLFPSCNLKVLTQI